VDFCSQFLDGPGLDEGERLLPLSCVRPLFPVSAALDVTETCNVRIFIKFLTSSCSSLISESLLLEACMHYTTLVSFSQESSPSKCTLLVVLGFGLWPMAAT
jgi:hypothetical protein